MNGIVTWRRSRAGQSTIVLDTIEAEHVSLPSRPLRRMNSTSPLAMTFWTNRETALDKSSSTLAKQRNSNCLKEWLTAERGDSLQNK